MEADNMNDDARDSSASRGSRDELYRAVRALLEGVNARYEKNPREWTCPHMQALDDMTQSEPQPTLTDAEREAVRYFAHMQPHSKDMNQRHAATLCGLLDRLN
jgi:hypothetical protein